MNTPKLTPAHCHALARAAEGRVFRAPSSNGNRIVWWIDQSPAPRNTTATVEVDDLVAEGLLELGPINAGLRRTAVPTDAGRALLATLNDPAKEQS